MCFTKTKLQLTIALIGALCIVWVRIDVVVFSVAGSLFKCAYVVAPPQVRMLLGTVAPSVANAPVHAPPKRVITPSWLVVERCASLDPPDQIAGFKVPCGSGPDA